MNNNGNVNGSFTHSPAHLTPSVTVTKNLPTYVSKLIPGKLYIIQHPLTPTIGYSDELIKYSEVRFKPNFEKFKFIVPVDTKSAFYDQKKGEVLAAKGSASGEDPDESEHTRAPKLDELTLEGTVIPKPTGSSRYVIGVIRKDQIHLCPVQAFVQIKPTFEYLNKADAKKQLTEGNADTETEDEEEATKVTVKFARNNRDGSNKDDPMRQKSYSTLQKEEDEEPWNSMKYDEYRGANIKLLLSNRIADEAEFTPLNTKHYLDLLFPKYNEITYESSEEKKSAPNSKTPISKLKQMTLPDQVKTLMTNGVALRYRQIEEFLRVKLKIVVEDVELIRTLQTAANVIQGCWVVRSDLVYPLNYVSSSHGISRDVMQDARDLILSKFTENRILERKKLCKLTKLPVEEITEILTPIARLVPRQGWEFKLPFDSEFSTQYPDVVQRQLQIWARKNEQKIRRMSGTSDRDGGVSQRRRSRTKSFSSDTDSGAESESRRRQGGRQRRLSSRSDAGILTHVEP
ncbi:unnamed protein product [Allacma fusca]|uniref:DNA-directed RNA polymerase III subunit RPC5 n=1 Tax=Allacma fusca TaxID=39272 RepID=A0A8J2KZQ4_9HEXA|nr:unnamed protein product [Allacma fusca]